MAERQTMERASEQDAPDDEEWLRRPLDRGMLALAAATVIVLVTLIMAGLMLAGGGQPVAAAPADDSVEAGFARDMQQHHAQAVRMSTIVRDATDDAEVRQLALDILLTQQQQIGQMYGWLSLWGLPEARSGAPMQWMTSAGSGGTHQGMPMPSGGATTDAVMRGMATEKQLKRLGTLQGRAAERYYLQLMIPHHQGGAEMAQTAARTAGQPQVLVLAREILRAQTAELTVLRKMLAARSGPLR